MHGKFRKSIKSISSINKNDGACNAGLVTSLILLVIGLCSACSGHELPKRLITLQKYKQMKSASLNFHDSATALIDNLHKTLLDIINCQESGFMYT